MIRGKSLVFPHPVQKKAQIGNHGEFSECKSADENQEWDRHK